MPDNQPKTKEPQANNPTKAQKPKSVVVAIHTFTTGVNEQHEHKLYTDAISDLVEKGYELMGAVSMNLIPGPAGMSTSNTKLMATLIYKGGK